MKNNKIKIIATVGPASYKANVLEGFCQLHLTWSRINMSHTCLENLEEHISQLQKYQLPICIDTEGSQVRTGDMGLQEICLNEGNDIRIYRHEIDCNDQQIYVRPFEALDQIALDDQIFIDFNSVKLRVANVSAQKNKGYIECNVMNGGLIGNNKGVSVRGKTIILPPFSHKDICAIEIAKKYNIKYFTISFVDHVADVLMFHNLYPEAMVIAKIETEKGVSHFDGILEVADGILIDRGDLSREIPPDQIPALQSEMIKKCCRADKDIYLASHVLDSLSEKDEPTEQEKQNIQQAVQQNVSGFVLTKETAIGMDPIHAIEVLDSIANSKEE